MQLPTALATGAARCAMPAKRVREGRREECVVAHQQLLEGLGKILALFRSELRERRARALWQQQCLVGPERPPRDDHQPMRTFEDDPLAPATLLAGVAEQQCLAGLFAPGELARCFLLDLGGDEVARPD